MLVGKRLCDGPSSPSRPHGLNCPPPPTPLRYTNIFEIGIPAAAPAQPTPVQQRACQHLLQDSVCCLTCIAVHCLDASLKHLCIQNATAYFFSRGGTQGGEGVIGGEEWYIEVRQRALFPQLHFLWIFTASSVACGLALPFTDNFLDRFCSQGVIEELDSAREWVYDEKTKTLYYHPNSTTAADR